MQTNKISYRGYRFPREIISHGVWLYRRFALSFRDVEELLAKRGVNVTYETVRQWCGKFGPEYAKKLRRRQGRLGDTWYLDEVFVRRWCMTRSLKRIPPSPAGDLHRTRTLSGIPRPVIVFRILQARLTSIRWPTSDRLLILGPKTVLYRNTAFSTRLRLP
jgi:hypothetical protein